MKEVRMEGRKNEEKKVRREAKKVRKEGRK